MKNTCPTCSQEMPDRPILRRILDVRMKAQCNGIEPTVIYLTPDQCNKLEEEFKSQEHSHFRGFRIGDKILGLRIAVKESDPMRCLYL